MCVCVCQEHDICIDFILEDVIPQYSQYGSLYDANGLFLVSPPGCRCTCEFSDINLTWEQRWKEMCGETVSTPASWIY